METENHGKECGVPLTPRESHTNTPVAKKTRRTARRQVGVKKMEDASPITQVAQPKTPSTSSKTLLETPRRSSRKSVRPPLDYDDIIDKHLRSANKDTSIVEAATTVDFEEGAALQKWSVAEVGRRSRKRGRKASRTINKKSKFIEEDAEIAGMPNTVDEKSTKPESLTLTQGADAEKKVETVSHPSEPEVNGKTKVLSEYKIEAVSITSEQNPIGETVVDADMTNIKSDPDDELVDLGLRPLSTDEPVSEGEDNEMPSLILLEDGELSTSVEPTKEADEINSDAEPQAQGKAVCLSADQIEDILNRTFDAVEQQDEANEHDFDMRWPKLQMSPDATGSPQKAIKIVLTDINDQATTLLKLDMPRERPSKPLGFCFPPLQSKPAFNFTTTVAAPGSMSNKKELPVPSSTRRRSKSISALNTVKTKGVSFYSPVEIAHVDEIDKRWDPLNDIHVTKRRKRSISMDDTRLKFSRIPKPIITPSKLQTRVKLPNFAAIHQKQFAKMENLVDHMERKAQRAKVLTNSATKMHLIPSSSQKSATKNTPSSNTSKPKVTRPRALKKIDLFSAHVLPTPTKVTDQERRRLMELPNPSIIAAKSANHENLKKTRNISVVAAKPAFNLSTSLAKSFAASMLADCNKSAAPVENKTTDRQQRHMAMFKGRSAAKHEGNANSGEFIRGVRLNRRFELQMQHRRQNEN